MAGKPPEKAPLRGVADAPELAAGVRRVRIARSDHRVVDDWVAVEEPLEIRVDGKPLAVTLRTPGHDRQLAAGFLYSEGVVSRACDIEAIEALYDPAHPGVEHAVGVLLREGARPSPERLEALRRDFLAVAACGLCGKRRLADVYQKLPSIEPLDCPVELLESLPGRMRPHQAVFAATGGLHAAALFDPAGELLTLYEDIGRHNAVDKLIGHFLLRGELPLTGRMLVVSGRAGFELVQKAMLAGVPVMAAVGAASSLAVQLARDGGMALYSFVGEGRSNRHV